tara:strand:+ start:368 stop:670 length:303 start_codon:yes stop_codon:yes gene_type:complete
MKLVFAVIGIYVVYLLTVTLITIVALWDWFIIPFGLPPIGYAHALGLSIVLNFLIPADAILSKVNDIRKDQGESKWMFPITMGLRPPLTLLFGWIVHSFM